MLKYEKYHIYLIKSIKIMNIINELNIKVYVERYISMWVDRMNSSYLVFEIYKYIEEKYWLE